MAFKLPNFREWHYGGEKPRSYHDTASIIKYLSKERRKLLHHHNEIKRLEHDKLMKGELGKK